MRWSSWDDPPEGAGSPARPVPLRVESTPGPRKIFHSAAYLRSHGRLLLRISRADLRARYAGSFLGVGWAVLTPALVLAIYAAVYLVIFKVRVPGLTPVGYVLYIFAGLVPYLAMAEAVSAGVPSVIANKTVLSNTVFPIDLAPVKAVLLSQATMAVGLGAILLGSLAFGHLRWISLLVVPLWLLLAIGLVGATWILSLLNIVLRDLQNFVSAALMVLLVASPIAYTPQMVPDSLRVFLAINPFAYYVTAFQSVLVVGVVPPPTDIAVVVALSLVIFAVGGWFFARTKAVLIDYV